MRILVPQKSDLAFTGSESLSYVYSAWSSSSVYYARDTKIRYQVGGVYYDYRCRSSHTSSAYRAPTNSYYWTKLGVSATTSGATYTTNVLLSDYDTWTASAEVKAGAIKFDPADHRDYLAPNLIASGYNTIRPSEAVLSDDEAIAARWSVVSNANAWAPFDLEVYTRLSSYNSSNALVDPVTLTFACPTNDTANAVILAGLSNVEDLTAVVSYGGQVKETLTADLEPSGTHYGATATSVILDLATPIPAGTAVSVALTLNAYNTAKPSLLGVATLARWPATRSRSAVRGLSESSSASCLRCSWCRRVKVSWPDLRSASAMAVICAGVGGGAARPVAASPSAGLLATPRR